MAKERVFSLDLLRVIACYMVIQVHAGEFYYIASDGAVVGGDDAHWVNLYNSLFRAAVPLFVLITGYFVLPVKDRMGTFFKKRFSRVAIPFAVWCALYAFYQYFMGQVDIQTALVNVLKIPVNFGTDVGHLWYVYMLIGLYLFFPIISPWLEKASRKSFHFYLVIWTVTMFLPYIHQIFPGVLGECFWNPTPMLYYFTGFLGFAILGFYLKRYCSLPNKLDLPLGIILVTVGYAVTYFVFDYRLATEKWVSDLELSWGYGTVNVGMMALGVFLIIKNIKCKTTWIKSAVTSVSNMSYAMYLVHIMMLNAFFAYFDGMFDSAAIKIPLIAACTFVVSYFVIKVISYLPKSKYITG